MYPHFLEIPTRWMDNDVYGHVNNVVYYSYFDTVINDYLIKEGGLDIHAGAVIGLCVESQCSFTASLAFPETVRAGLRVGKLGTSSVRYEIGLYGEGPRSRPPRATSSTSSSTARPAGRRRSPTASAAPSSDSPRSVAGVDGPCRTTLRRPFGPRHL